MFVPGAMPSSVHANPIPASMASVLMQGIMDAKIPSRGQDSISSVIPGETETIPARSNVDPSVSEQSTERATLVQAPADPDLVDTMESNRNRSAGVLPMVFDETTQDRAGSISSLVSPRESAASDPSSAASNPSSAAEPVRPIMDPRSTTDPTGRLQIPEQKSAPRPSNPTDPHRVAKPAEDRQPAERSARKRPAALARAERINQEVQESRSGSLTSASASMAGSTPRSSGRITVPGAQTLPGAAAGPAPEGEGRSTRRTMPGVGRGLETLALQRGGTLTMRLDPPSLGQLKLEMRMDGTRVTVLLTSASESARSLLRENLGSLRMALEDRGMAVDRLAVESAARTGDSGSNHRSEHRGDEQARGGQEAADRQDAGEGRSRGRRDDASDRQADHEGDSQRPEVADFGEAMAEAAASGN